MFSIASLVDSQLTSSGTPIYWVKRSKISPPTSFCSEFQRGVKVIPIALIGKSNSAPTFNINKLSFNKFQLEAEIILSLRTDLWISSMRD